MIAMRKWDGRFRIFYDYPTDKVCSGRLMYRFMDLQRKGYDWPAFLFIFG